MNRSPLTFSFLEYCFYHLESSWTPKTCFVIGLDCLFEKWSVQVDIACWGVCVCVCVCTRLPGRFGAPSLSMSKWAISCLRGGQNVFARMV